MNGQIRDMLIEAAQQRRVLFYAEVGKVLNLDMDNPYHRQEIGRILGEISTDEHNDGCPLLSAVVVHQENHRPGQGFFNLARELGIQEPGEDNETFYTNELNRVFNEWANAR